MPGPAEIIAGIGGAVDALLPLAKFGYSIYQDQRDTRYQHNLQDTIFSREDNAIQRRMADLEAAGLNPNLAAGQGAGAGQVVGRSSGQSVNTSGGTLDAMLALAQLAKVSQETENAKEERKGIKFSNKILETNSNLNLFEALRAMGYKPLFNPWTNTFAHQDEWDYGYTDDEARSRGFVPFNYSPTNLDWLNERGMLRDTARLRNVDANWANVQKGVNIGSQIVGDLVGLGTGSIYIGKGLQGLTGIKRNPVGFQFKP